MKFLSICSGIEAASVAFAPLGWQALAFAEIEPFPCAVLAHHYPQVPNLGDLSRWREWPAELLTQVELLCGGTPCQAFSVAGLRNSLADDRGNLSLIFCELYAHINTLRRAAGLAPALLLWENVPGVLSTHDNAFGCYLAGIAGEDHALIPPGPAPKPGRPHKWPNAGAVYGPAAAAAWRVLDAQYFGLAQRRKRVFLVASPDPAFDPAAVLFEFAGLRRDTPPSRQTRQDLASTLSARTKGGGGLGSNADADADADADGACIPEKIQSQEQVQVTGPFLPPQTPDVAGTLSANGKAAGSATQQDADQGLLITVAFGGNNQSGPLDLATCRSASASASGRLDFESETFLVETAHTLRAVGFNAGEDGTGRGTPLVPVAFPERLSGTQCASSEDLSPVLQSHNPTAVAFQPGNLSRGAGANPSIEVFPTLKSDRGRGSSDQSPCVAFQPRIARNGSGYMGEPVNALQAQSGQSGKGDAAPCVAYAIQERAICENPDAGPDGVGVRSDNLSYTLEARQVPQAVAFQNTATWRVRRLTPEECELLQGFPVGYTLIPGWTTKKRKGEDLRETVAFLESLGLAESDAAVLAHSPDGPRYKALGNSWAVPCAGWIGERINQEIKTKLHNT